MKRFLLTLICLAVIIGTVFYVVSVPHERLDLRAVGGVLDLRNANPGEDVFALAGEWEFYWDRLYEPGDFTDDPREDAKHRTGYTFIETPMAWNGAGYPRIGHATYRLTLLLPDEGAFMLYVPEILSSSAVWVNGEKIFTAGQVGASREGSIPFSKNDILSLPSRNGTAEVIVQASNYYVMNGGIRHAFRIGSERGLPRWAFSRWLALSGVTGAFFLMGLYHLMLYLSGRSSRGELIYLVFAVCCVLGGIRFLFEQDSIAQFFLRGTLNTYINTVYWVLFTFHSCSGVVFTAIALELELSRRMKIFLALLQATPLIMMALPAPLNRFGLFVNAIPLLMIMILAIRSLSIERVRERPYLGLFLAVLLCYVCWGPVTNGRARAFFFATSVFSNMFIMLSQCIMLSLDYVEARKKAYVLEEENRLLDRLAAIKDLFWTNLNHEVRNPLAVISAKAQLIRMLIQRGGADKERISEAADTVKENAALLARMMEDAEDSPSNVRTLDLGSLFKKAARLYADAACPEKRRKSLSFDMEKDLPPVLGNADKLVRAFSDLLENADANMEKGEITVKAARAGHQILAEVAGTGTGTDSEPAGQALEPGGPLYVCRLILTAHGGAIGIERAPAGGTRVFFSLPVEPERRGA
ncbi:MAG: sensor histidine kinase [Synergistaceae bacterium]|nr:sensor histidine kinase [Synergistaceae bacterium]